MPGSCGSEQNSSSVISSLRQFRFQNKSKNSVRSNTAESSSSSSNVAVNSSQRSGNQKSITPAYNPLSYRRYNNAGPTVSLQSIQAKIQQILSCNNSNSILDLKVSTEETRKLKDTVLQRSALSEKWSSNVTEQASLTASSEKILKIRRIYLFEILKYISNLNSKSSSNSGEQLTVKQPTKTYERFPNNNLSKKTVASASPKQGAMDDYEAFCEKELCLRKMLDAFPGADIMEAQDILVKCEWDLNKALQFAKNQPLRATRKRSFPGASPSPAMSTNTLSPRSSEPEEIVLDSSDEEMNGSDSRSDHQNASQTSLTQQSATTQPAAKRARRLISTSTSSEDETAPSKPQQSQAPSRPQQPQSQVSSKPQMPSSQAPTKPQQPLSQPPAQKANLSKSRSTSPSNTNSAIVDKSINIPESLSIKPVSKPPAEDTEKNNSSSMPKLPKGLVISQVGGKSKVDSDECTSSDSDKAVNGNISNIPSKSSKSAHLVRIKSVNSTASNSSKTSLPKGSTITPVPKGVSITPVSQTIIPKGVSLTPINPGKVSITPVGGTDMSSGSRSGNSSEEESSENKSKESQAKENILKESMSTENLKRIKNVSDLKNDGESEHSGDSDIERIDEPKKRVEKSKSHRRAISKRKRYSSDEDEEYGNEDIYDSEDSECEENLTPAHSAVLKFFQESSADELGTIPGCSKKKIEVIQNLRPFTRWKDLVDKLKNDKTLSTDLLNGAKKVIDMRNAINKLMNKCQRISLDMEDLVENLKENKETCTDYVSKQPELLNNRMHLTSYQMLGLNWLLLMYNQDVNGILADEMGLGKTIQAISFLAYLKQIDSPGPHLIVVPSSTLDNWKKELETWWPAVKIICYHGSQETRRELRMQILNDDIDDFDIMITTYNMVTSNAEDRSFFKRLEFNYVIFDEAHMLKNMASQRYQHLMRIKAPRRLLLTGTPLQNNLVELMSLLIFAMPNMFSGKTEQIKQMFSCVSKSEGNKNNYERDRIDHAKRIMKPFVLRRLKKDVLKELPSKVDEIRHCEMVEDQLTKYEELVKKFSAQVQVENPDEEKETSCSGSGMMMQLRRAANHPLLLRRFYNDEKLQIMSKKMLKEPTHCNSDPNMIFEDMAVMSDFELHKLCKQFKSIKSFALPDSTILNSGKFKIFDELLPDLLKEDHRILIFSQFTMVLDIIQEYMNIKNYKYLRLDGQTPVVERQQLIDDFNNDPEIQFFLLSTRAGGLGINLTAADTVILHDIDFNPYNDKQAEDRCHRVGQVRDVRVVRLITKNSIEEGILQRAKEKLKLESDIHDENETEENDTASVAQLLRDALGLTQSKS